MAEVHTKLRNGQVRIEIGDKSFTIDASDLDSTADLSVRHIRDGLYSILYEGKSISAVFAPVNESHYRVTVGEDVVSINILDRRQQLLEEYGEEAGQSDHELKITAPMPGLVLNIQAQPGSKVFKNDPLLVLEAMKMENEIRSPGSGIVSSVHVKPGDTVMKGSLLLEIESVPETG